MEHNKMDSESCGNLYDGLLDNKPIESGAGISGSRNKEVGKHCRSDLNIPLSIWSNSRMSNCISCASFAYVFPTGPSLKTASEGKTDMKFAMARMDLFLAL